VQLLLLNDDLESDVTVPEGCIPVKFVISSFKHIFTCFEYLVIHRRNTIG
jgi:hypothetical protein